MRVLVTGGAGGLGAALARRFVDRGDQVLSVDLTDPDPDAVPGAVARRLDVTSESDWAATRDWVAAEWGGLDVLVNNAGIAGGGRVDRCSLDEWRTILEVNLLGVVGGTRAFVAMMKAQGSGRIVNTASLAGLVHPPGMGSYNATKAAVVAFSETMSHELAPYGVGCTAVCPSYFRTGLMSSMRGEDEGLAQIVTRMVETSSITADEIAAAVLTGIDEGQDLVVPDEPARIAYALKRSDPEAYTAQMRRLGASLKERS